MRPHAKCGTCWRGVRYRTTNDTQVDRDRRACVDCRIMRPRPAAHHSAAASALDTGSLSPTKRDDPLDLDIAIRQRQTRRRSPAAGCRRRSECSMGTPGRSSSVAGSDPTVQRDMPSAIASKSSGCCWHMALIRTCGGVLSKVAAAANRMAHVQISGGNDAAHRRGKRRHDGDRRDVLAGGRRSEVEGLVRRVGTRPCVWRDYL